MSTLPATDVAKLPLMPDRKKDFIEPARVVPAATRTDAENPDKIRGADLDLWRQAQQQAGWEVWP